MDVVGLAGYMVGLRLDWNHLKTLAVARSHRVAVELAIRRLRTVVGVCPLTPEVAGGQHRGGHGRP